jgi:hypothetical protein
MLSSVSHDSCATVSCILRFAFVSFKMFRAYRMITVRIILSSTLLQTACKGTGIMLEVPVCPAAAWSTVLAQLACILCDCANES